MLCNPSQYGVGMYIYIKIVFLSIIKNRYTFSIIFLGQLKYVSYKNIYATLKLKFDSKTEPSTENV